MDGAKVRPLIEQHSGTRPVPVCAQTTHHKGRRASETAWIALGFVAGAAGSLLRYPNAPQPVQ